MVRSLFGFILSLLQAGVKAQPQLACGMWWAGSPQNTCQGMAWKHECSSLPLLAPGSPRAPEKTPRFSGRGNISRVQHSWQYLFLLSLHLHLLSGLALPEISYISKVFGPSYEFEMFRIPKLNSWQMEGWKMFSLEWQGFLHLGENMSLLIFSWYKSSCQKLSSDTNVLKEKNSP